MEGLTLFLLLCCCTCFVLAFGVFVANLLTDGD